MIKLLLKSMVQQHQTQKNTPSVCPYLPPPVDSREINGLQCQHINIISINCQGLTSRRSRKKQPSRFYQQGLNNGLNFSVSFALDCQEKLPSVFLYLPHPFVHAKLMASRSRCLLQNCRSRWWITKSVGEVRRRAAISINQSLSIDSTTIA